MIRIQKHYFKACLVWLLANPLVTHAQYLTTNNTVPPRMIPTAIAGDGDPIVKSTSARSGDSTVKSTPDRSSKKVVKKPLAPGWVKEDDRVTGSINKEMLTRLRATNASMIGYLYDTLFNGPAMHPAWHGEFMSDKSVDSMGIKYGVKCMFAGSASAEDVSLPGTLEITANDFSPMVRQVIVYGREYKAIAPMKGVRNQCQYFEPPFVLSNAQVAAIKAGRMNAPHVNTWLVTTRPDELPYVAMTRKEYLENVDSSLKSSKNAMIKSLKEKNPVRSQEVQDAEKQKALETLSATYSGVELQMRKRRFMENYKTDEEDQKQIIDGQTAELDSTISFVEGMLHKLSPATLGAPAYVPARATEFEGFADGEADAVMLVHLKRVFTDGTIGAESPRFFIVSYTYDPSNEAQGVVREQLLRQLDVSFLKSLMKK